MRQLNHAHGIEVFLFLNGILFKDYEKYVKGVSQRLKQASVAAVLGQKLAVEDLRHGDMDKDRSVAFLHQRRCTFVRHDRDLLPLIGNISEGVVPKVWFR